MLNTYSASFREISGLIEQLSLKVTEYIKNQSNIQINFREDLYTYTYSYIVQQIKGEVVETETQQLIRHIRQTIQEFKIDLFQMAAKNPQMPLFDFLVSQQFNDLYDVLTATHNQLNDQKQLKISTPQKCNRQKEYIYQDKQVRIRSNSLNSDSRNNQIDLQFALLSQYVYDNIGVEVEEEEYSKVSSPKSLPKSREKKNDTLPQLFSFDSTFLKDLPLSRFNQVSNFDDFNTTDNKFNFTLVNQTNEEEYQPVVQTSRFENHQIEEEDDYPKTEYSSSLDDYCIKRLDTSMISQQSDNRQLDQSLSDKYRQLIEKEKQVAQRELKTIISEKHLMNRTYNLNKENIVTNQNSYELYCQQVNILNKQKQEHFKKQNLENIIILQEDRSFERINVFVNQ